MDPKWYHVVDLDWLLNASSPLSASAELLVCMGRDHQDDRGWPGWRRCRMTSTPTGCHGPTQSTWPRTDHSGGCWQPVVLCIHSGASRRRRRYCPRCSKKVILEDYLLFSQQLLGNSVRNFTCLSNHPYLPTLNCQAAFNNLQIWFWYLFTHIHSVLTAIFPGEPGLAGCPLNSPSPFIPGLRILLGQT